MISALVTEVNDLKDMLTNVNIPQSDSTNNNQSDTKQSNLFIPEWRIVNNGESYIRDGAGIRIYVYLSKFYCQDVYTLIPFSGTHIGFNLILMTDCIATTWKLTPYGPTFVRVCLTSELFY